MSRSTRYLVWSFVAFAAAGSAVAGAIMLEHFYSSPLITVVHLPDVYPRRGASLSANVTAHVPTRDMSIRYKVNDHPWHRIDKLWSDRFVGRVVTFEMPAQELRPGINRLEIVANAWMRPEERHQLSFSYDPSPVKLPLRRIWRGEELEAQDGAWEVIEVEGEARVRPKPGYEGYDRLLLVTGAFPVPRRIETDVVYRHARPTHRKEVGFGVLSLWGGHPGSWSQLPRRGWSFALGLYWSKPGGVGNEISHYDGETPPRWVNSYRDTPLVADGRYHIIIEVEEERADGQHLFYRQRIKMWLDGQPEPDEWTVVTDKEGAPLPDGEYAVSLFTLDCQVEFGPVTVLPLPTRHGEGTPR